jgi:maltooligosyltrehalose trehalohydrolase
MRFGTEIVSDGVRFRLWAPKHERIDIVIDKAEMRFSMTASQGGWHTILVPEAGPGTLYRFVLPDGLEVPDPASRFQPHDVHGPSEVIDPQAYLWRTTAWRGRPWETCVIYELHVGALTYEGTFRAAVQHLDQLAALGVTAIELMPVADFPGKRNWGYDGVLLFAPDSSYGRPDDLKALIDAAHERQIAVLLDVVYNHFGPEGNYLPSYAPLYTEGHKTPWGPAINYDAHGSDVIRELIISNARFWIEEYRFDGLRLDAVHAIKDDSEKHLLYDIAAHLRETFPDRHLHLVLENEENQASWLRRDAAGRPMFYSAQWADDVHHGLHTAATGEAAGYYQEYAGDIGKLARSLAEGFAFQGQIMHYRGRVRGEPSAGLPPTAFVSFIQNHDQIGNRAFGERIDTLAPAETVRAAAAIYLLTPQIPMIFMGEEWAAAQPFLFFCDFGPDLASVVREGRRAEFARFPEFRDPERAARIPDPCASETFTASKLAWEDAREGPHAQRLELYQRLLAVRRREIIPRLANMAGGSGRYEVLAHAAIRVTWKMADESILILCANLSSDPLVLADAPRGRLIWVEGKLRDTSFDPWTVAWFIDDPDHDVP